MGREARVPRDFPKGPEERALPPRQPLVVIALSPEGFLEAMVNVPEDGTQVNYQSVEHIRSLHTTLTVAEGLIHELIEHLPLTAAGIGEKPS